MDQRNSQLSSQGTDDIGLALSSDDQHRNTWAETSKAGTSTGPQPLISQKRTNIS